MGAGLEIYNKNNAVVIGETIPDTLVLLGTGSAAISGEVFTAKGLSNSTVYHFGPIINISPASYGFQVYDTNGATLLFDAVNGGKVLRPVANISGTLPGFPTQTAPYASARPDTTTTVNKTWTGVAGKKYAAAIMNQPSSLAVQNWIVPSPSFHYTYFIDFQSLTVSQSGNVVTVSAHRDAGPQGSATSQTPFSDTYELAFNVLIVDVTGY